MADDDFNKPDPHTLADADQARRVMTNYLKSKYPIDEVVSNTIQVCLAAAAKGENSATVYLFEPAMWNPKATKTKEFGSKSTLEEYQKHSANIESVIRSELTGRGYEVSVIGNPTMRLGGAVWVENHKDMTEIVSGIVTPWPKIDGRIPSDWSRVYYGVSTKDIPQIRFGDLYHSHPSAIDIDVTLRGEKNQLLRNLTLMDGPPKGIGKSGKGIIPNLSRGLSSSHPHIHVNFDFLNFSGTTLQTNHQQPRWPTSKWLDATGIDGHGPRQFFWYNIFALRSMDIGWTILL